MYMAEHSASLIVRSCVCSYVNAQKLVLIHTEARVVDLRRKAQVEEQIDTYLDVTRQIGWRTCTASKWTTFICSTLLHFHKEQRKGRFSDKLGSSMQEGGAVSEVVSYL